MIEQKPVDRSVAALDEGVGKTSDIQPLHSFFPIVTAAEELDAAIWMVGVELRDLWNVSK
jgi:hypothetical protein